ncbi:MAG: replication-relaxation family protein [Pseudonocardia sp.]
MRRRLGERDLVILRTLATFRLMTGRQLQRLHVTDKAPVTAARRMRAVLRRLSELRVLVRLERRIGGVQAGSDGMVYGLSGLGCAVLALDDPAGHRPKPIGSTKPAFQDHVLAVAKLYVQLRERHALGLAELITFEAEPACWRTHASRGGDRAVLKPDAHLVLGVGDYERAAFIELDTGSESLPTVSRKCRRYLDYWQSGQEQQASGVFPRVWWLVPTERRRDGIAGVIERLAADERALFTVAVTPDAAALLSAPVNDGGTS